MTTTMTRLPVLGLLLVLAMSTNFDVHCQILQESYLVSVRDQCVWKIQPFINTEPLDRQEFVYNVTMGEKHLLKANQPKQRQIQYRFSISVTNQYLESDKLLNLLSKTLEGQTEPITANKNIVKNLTPNSRMEIQLNQFETIVPCSELDCPYQNLQKRTTKAITWNRNVIEQTSIQDRSMIYSSDQQFGDSSKLVGQLVLTEYFGTKPSIGPNFGKVSLLRNAGYSFIIKATVINEQVANKKSIQKEVMSLGRKLFRMAIPLELNNPQNVRKVQYDNRNKDGEFVGRSIVHFEVLRVIQNWLTFTPQPSLILSAGNGAEQNSSTVFDTKFQLLSTNQTKGGEFKLKLSNSNNSNNLNLSSSSWKITPLQDNLINGNFMVRVTIIGDARFLYLDRILHDIGEFARDYLYRNGIRQYRTVYLYQEGSAKVYVEFDNDNQNQPRLFYKTLIERYSALQLDQQNANRNSGNNSPNLLSAANDKKESKK